MWKIDVLYFVIMLWWKQLYNTFYWYVYDVDDLAGHFVFFFIIDHYQWGTFYAWFDFVGIGQLHG